MAAPSLPAPRALLNTLLGAITHIPLAHDPADREQANLLPRRTTVTVGDDAERPSNVLRRIPPEYRHLIITLHVLFPDAVLPALDLLDRGLVSRVVLDHALDFGRAVKVEGGLPKPAPVTASSTRAGAGARADTEPEMNVKTEVIPNAAPPSHSPGPAMPTIAAIPTAAEPKPKAPAFYLVRSANMDRDRGSNRNHSRRRRRAPSGLGAEGDVTVGETATATKGGKVYVVRLGAWNCTCAAYAFASFPVGSESGSGSGERDGGDDGAGLDCGDDEVGGLSWPGFGGTTVDDGGGVPVCKHLMACLLAERWSPALGHHVVECRVGREEMAGIMVES